MTKPPEVATVVRQWTEKAEHDLKNAEHTMLMDPADCPFDTVCYHAQQCGEKYLKALLTFLSIDFHKIHDIGEWIDLLPSLKRPPIEPRESELLADYAIASRYPGEPEPLGSDQASEALNIARKIREFVKKQLV